MGQEATRSPLPAAESASHTTGDPSALRPELDASELSADVDVRLPQFASMQPSETPTGALPLDRFYDVNIKVWAELGRVEMPIGDVLQLGDGVVLKLNRPVSQPVDLVAQGVRLARGEVVVVDDCFAVRITEIEQSKANSV
jgi:flagellar motor switch protein FliN/FliY